MIFYKNNEGTVKILAVPSLFSVIFINFATIKQYKNKTLNKYSNINGRR